MRRSADQVKRLSLELGGHAPFHCLPDADPEAVAKIAVMGKFRNNGQVCISPSRFYVHKDIAEKVHRSERGVGPRLEARQRPGAGRRDRPDVRQKAMEQAASLIEDARGPRRQGADRRQALRASSTSGYFFEPTVLSNITPAMKLMTEEPFAPVMPLLDFRKLDEVIAAANNTRYGLAAYVSPTT
jgi:succinate-semialdehyde dehydrogenase / glutarate-semialdehyde dehydrogenase